MSSASSETLGALRGGPGRGLKSASSRVLALVALAAVVLGAGLALALSHGANDQRAADSIYAYHKGQIPAWIPNANAPANPAPVVATLRTPASTLVEGDTVHAVFADGMAMVNVSGPVEPDSAHQAIIEGKSGTHSPGTFTVTFNDVQGVVPVAATGFLAMTPGNNKLAPTKVWVQGGGRVPATLRQGQRLTLVVRFASLPEGEGALAWTPEANRLLAGWDFDFELT